MKEEMANQNDPDDQGADPDGETRAQQEEQVFADYIRGKVPGELRADVNMTFGDNGAVIPKSIVKKIITKVYDICPILEKATRYNVKGQIAIPCYPADVNDNEVAYANEFEELAAKSGKFDSITLSGFLAGTLAKISQSLINNSEFDIVSFVINHIAEKVALWIEKELLLGTSGKIEGLSKIETGITTESATEITTDELIELQGSIKDVLQKNAIWIMSQKTRTALRKLKDKNGRYLLQDDITAPFGNTLLGKPIYVSDNMPDIAAGKKAIYYGDFSGLAVKFAEEMQLQVLREKYATQHAVGIVGWMELDSKIEDKQKMKALVMKTA
jgi:HK97 family phage major capsid protein